MVMRSRVAGASRLTCGLMTAEWYFSRLATKVSVTAMPMAPPRFRIMLKSEEAELVSLGAMPAVTIRVIVGKIAAWPRARIRLGMSSCGPLSSGPRLRLRKALTQKTMNPKNKI